MDDEEIRLREEAARRRKRLDESIDAKDRAERAPLPKPEKQRERIEDLDRKIAENERALSKAERELLNRIANGVSPSDGTPRKPRPLSDM